MNPFFLRQNTGDSDGDSAPPESIRGNASIIEADVPMSDKTWCGRLSAGIYPFLQIQFVGQILEQPALFSLRACCGKSAGIKSSGNC